jgi:hypothetical protein
MTNHNLKPAINKRCGTCKFWSRGNADSYDDGRLLADCTWTFEFPDPLPESAMYSGFVTYKMEDDEGHNCPVYQKVED